MTRPGQRPKPGALSCPFCSGPLDRPIVADGSNFAVCCANCGDHLVTGTLRAELANAPLEVTAKARLGHALVRVPAGKLLTSDFVKSLLDTTRLPAAADCVDNLVLYLAREVEVGHAIELSPETMVAAIGARSPAGSLWSMEQATQLGYLELSDVGYVHELARTQLAKLTMRGWSRYDELMRSGAGSRHAFMAMRFDDEEVERVFREHLVPAVAAAGFDLRTTNGAHQTAGSIDNRMRVEIRTSRFLVCDLTHGNRGAYWEAGFAEGLGRPVFYICRADVLADGTHPDRPHFDTRQQLIIPWNQDAPASGAQALKDAIRATLPGEAKMGD